MRTNRACYSRSRIKTDEDGVADWWWERSPYGSNSGGFCNVGSGGGVCFGFYI